ncbi:Phosphatidylinositol 3,4,5-trisphosphate-dependent Rac exchanger 2 protein [Geodia barretti]|uniref:Phosphatidylinositol 3,4,5-trisphosphate-dependent Rac exchanger 2 protein n=1 Tax=Geodia barretti TaxID=519541 RepID=A0AA35XGL7_GEOBA|nr:Phosphatidylinositol 3,4,5-trisphosphate-dependent Rac exchanger 2 protein [Geodia barretti]
MSDDKIKRLRTHVVKELYDTEADYTAHLEFTVTVLLEKARVKGQHDNTFTESVLGKLFCNIEDILQLHRRLVEELKACLKGGVSYSCSIAGVYHKFKEEFLIYQDYGKGNEAAQKLLYELEDNEGFQAFFLACLLLGGRDGGNGISSYLFKPIQRVTKYPLLFRELEKYTPRDHPDYEATRAMGVRMREICFVINEAKRGVEKLDAITDWQATVDGWEGSKVTDTCNQLIKEGALIKISAGNTQERMFFLFDNLFVYCKKSLLSRTRPLLFRGRIPMENLDVEDIEDGTADFHTGGITVTNSWKVHNIAKDKWFVLIARTPEEKKEWMDAIRAEKEKKKTNDKHQFKKGELLYRFRYDDGTFRQKYASSELAARGVRMYCRLHGLFDPIIRDHKGSVIGGALRNVLNAQKLIEWLLEEKDIVSRDEGVALGRQFVALGVLRHGQPLSLHSVVWCSETW